MGRASPPRPSRREQSPTRHKSSNPDKASSRNRSPRRSRSRSPMYHSSKPSNHTKSPIRRKSPSRSPVKQPTASRIKSPKRLKPRSPSPNSPAREKPRLRDRSPERVNSRRSMSKSRSPESRSPSPRSRRLKRVRAEYDVEKRNRKEYERKGDRVVGEAKNLDKNLPSESEKKERKQGRDVVNNNSRSRRERSASPGVRHHRGRHRSRSPYNDDNNRGRDDERTNRRSSEDRNVDDDSIAKMRAAEEKLESKEKEKQKPSFELSGKLAEETNRFRGITLLFNEPPDARKPDVRWRLYVFKGGEVLNEPLYIHRQSCYLFGRERRVADIPTDHPSCSKQHAVLQYRQVEEENPDGTISKKVRPYLMDLGSTNKTFINDTPMEPQRYYELFEKDTIKFGNSSREYVLLHENSAT